MSYPDNLPTGIYQLREYDFGLNDKKLIPLDENTFKQGFRNKDESILESVPDAHQANWLYNYFNKHLVYTEKTALENKNLLATKVATPTSIGQIKIGYGLNIANDGTLSVSKGVAEDATIISYDLPVGSMMFWTGNTEPEYFIEAKGQNLVRSTYPELYEFARANDLIGDGKLFTNGDGSTYFTIADLRDNFVKIGASGEIVGRKEAEGLPNITGSFAISLNTWGANGAFYNSGTGNMIGGSGSWNQNSRNVEMNASRSSSIYGASSHVTPRNIALKLIVKAKPTPPTKVVPIGTILDYTGTEAPIGFIPANGATLNRSEFPDLYNWAVANELLIDQASIPSTAHGYFGTGDGSTTFTIPDLRGIFRRGADLSSGRGGTSVGAYQSDGLPTHNHILYTKVNVQGSWFGYEGGRYTGYCQPQVGGTYTNTTTNAGGDIYGKADHVRPRNVSILPIIKY